MGKPFRIDNSKGQPRWYTYVVDMPKIKRLKVPVKNPEFLSEDQVGAILSAAEPRVRPMIQFLIFTGMRKGEMAHLE